MIEFLRNIEDAIPMAKDLVLTGAAVVAAYVGLTGLNAWRRQLAGNTEYLLARQLLKSVYEMREAISSVRNPFMRYGDEPDLPAEKLKDLPGPEKHFLAKAQAYQRRWEPIPKARASLDQLVLEAEVVWGKGIVKKVRPLYKLVEELFGAIEDHLEASNPNAPCSAPEPDESKRLRAIMYARGNAGSDDYYQRLQDAIAGIEEELKPHIKQYHC